MRQALVEEASGGLSFSKNKPKGPVRENWDEVRKGDRWDAVKKHLPKENVTAPRFLAFGTKDQVVQRAKDFLLKNAVVQDWTGRTVLLPYGQTRGNYGDPISNRAEHLIAHDEEQGTHNRQLRVDKAQ
ncbi:hypothetical protein BH10PLA2_BH10PLA2_20550 [soil metagenome]